MLMNSSKKALFTIKCDFCSNKVGKVANVDSDPGELFTAMGWRSNKKGNLFCPDCKRKAKRDEINKR